MGNIRKHNVFNGILAWFLAVRWGPPWVAVARRQLWGDAFKISPPEVEAPPPKGGGDRFVFGRGGGPFRFCFLGSPRLVPPNAIWSMFYKGFGQKGTQKGAPAGPWRFLFGTVPYPPKVGGRLQKGRGGGGFLGTGGGGF